jgi:hypothetical protein
VKCYRFKRQNSFAGFIYRFNVFLKAARGGTGAQLVIGINYDRNPTTRFRAVNASYVGLRLSKPDIDPIGDAGMTTVANKNIIIACSGICSRRLAERDVTTAGGVNERLEPYGRVAYAADVISEGPITNGRVFASA